jgi:hypothetical protein
MFSHHVSINFVRRLSAAAAFRYLLTGFPAETLKRMAHPTPGGPLAAGWWQLFSQLGSRHRMIGS